MLLILFVQNYTFFMINLSLIFSCNIEFNFSNFATFKGFLTKLN